MRKKSMAIIICAVAIFAVIIIVANMLLTNFIENTNIVCKGQTFSSAEEAIRAMETSERAANDTSLDYTPPYRLLYTFDYDENTIVFYSYCYTFDGKESSDYAVRVLKHNEDGTLSFDSGFADFRLTEPTDNNDYYYYTNIVTSKGTKSISFLYLPKDSDKNIYVDGIKAEKILAKIEEREFYICYAISDRDSFLSNLFTSISNRHKIVVK